MARFLADHYFHIGRTHLNGGKPCQDYALSEVLEGAAFAIISDGCSTGGHTDVGARILTLSTAKALREHRITKRTTLGANLPLEIAIRQQVILFGWRDALGLTTNDMLATCAYAYLSAEGGFVHLQGDGVIALKHRSGEIDLFRYDWLDNRPVYTAYAGDSYAGFIAAHGGDRMARKLEYQHWHYFPEGKREYELWYSGGHTLADGIGGITIALELDKVYGHAPSAELDDELEYVAVFTDGVTRFKDLEWKDAARQLLAFKTAKGEFAKRRAIRAIRDAEKSGNTPMDDVGMAVIRVLPPEKGDAP